MRMQRIVPRKEWKVLWGLIVPVILLTVIVPAYVVAEDDEMLQKKKLREKKYYYQAFNRRDPFQSLIVGEFEESEFELVDIYSVKLVGVLSGGMERFAMLEDNNGFGYILKTGDPIKNGSIVSVGDRSLVARVTMFGQTSSVTLLMEGANEKGE
ncbi:MAG: hypothetical protein JSV33_03750 [bacterium]|nr:MAG: hypothetical protein JSV33_03750 [bacterium]